MLTNKLNEWMVLTRKWEDQIAPHEYCSCWFEVLIGKEERKKFVRIRRRKDALVRLDQFRVRKGGGLIEDGMKERKFLPSTLFRPSSFFRHPTLVPREIRHHLSPSSFPIYLLTQSLCMCIQTRWEVVNWLPFLWSEGRVHQPSFFVIGRETGYL